MFLIAWTQYFHDVNLHKSDQIFAAKFVHVRKNKKKRNIATLTFFCSKPHLLTFTLIKKIAISKIRTYDRQTLFVYISAVLKVM